MTRRTIALACLAAPLISCSAGARTVKPAAPAAAPAAPVAAAVPAVAPSGPATATVFETILFEYDQAAIAPDRRDAIRRIADALLAHPTVAITLEGHCDERGTDEYNLDLGWKRAYAVRDALTRLGIGDARLFPVSYGRARPAVIGSDESSWRLNRRVECPVRN